MREKKKSKNKSVFWLFTVAFVSVGLLLFCQFFYGDTVNQNTIFFDGTTINGIDVSGLNKKQAENVVSAKMLENLDDVSLTFTYQDQVWQYKGSDFEVNPNISAKLDEAIAYGREGNIIEKTKSKNRIKSQGLKITVPYSDILCGFDNKIEEIATQIEKAPQESRIDFNPNENVMFTIVPSENGVQLDREKLAQQLQEEFYKGNNVVLQLPVLPILPNNSQELMLDNIAQRSSFSTNYSNSSSARKNNVALALSKFNGMVVAPGDEVSFNKTTGQRNEENGYKKANVIQNGVFVEGNGGGVCQASTTLYNALLLADVEIKQVHHHSLPVSYVPLSTDAMVSEGYADLVFVNNTLAPIYIKTIANTNEVCVQIYGAPFEDGESFKLRSELVNIIAHSGDKIVQDYSGQYNQYVLYKGEYYRIKYPKEGYESKAFLQKLQDGKVVGEKMIRHDFYYPQEGVIVEGSENLAYGMTLPRGDVTPIPAQIVTKSHFEAIKNKFKNTYPDAYEL